MAFRIAISIVLSHLLITYITCFILLCCKTLYYYYYMSGVARRSCDHDTRIESYTVSSGHTSAVSTLGHEEEQATIAAIDPVTKLTRMVERLSEQVEVLQIVSKSKASTGRGESQSSPEPTRARLSKAQASTRSFESIQWRMLEVPSTWTVHTARNCTQNSISRQGN